MFSSFNFLAFGATPAWVNALGVFVIIIVFLLGGAVLVMHLWKGTRPPPAEPAHTPGIDTKIHNKIEEAETRIGAVIGTVKAELREDQIQHREKVDKDLLHLHGRVSKSRDETAAEYKTLASKVESGVEKMQQTHLATIKEIGAIAATAAAAESKADLTASNLREHVRSHK